ncbi:hypothetical protein DXG03_000449 [Asterophora parasitica]|uniref:Uncharacterized protein n=1 Tax=Asterophora parasitica TaxID=117018 RepID=A0A9P7KCX2_9AGAR|nr:hypothetical protein DXG03_000449 [Asterophora parasitica]
MPPLVFAYYCSGHGYGHATRVSAFASHLLNLPPPDRPTVYITSSAPQHVFADSIVLGARYRYAEIDPVIVQPLAYRVDRQKSVDVLSSFLSRKEKILDVEKRWLLEIRAHAVLSDAAFLGCLAAKATGIPSILITNFTFDSVYSYLSTPLLQVDLESPTADHLSPLGSLSLVPDIPVSPSQIDPLVAQIHHGYRCADLLFLLPGCIPIPAFSIYPALPAPEWVNAASNRFHDRVIEFLLRSPCKASLHPPLPPFTLSSFPAFTPIPREVIAAPLLVRPPSSSSFITNASPSTSSSPPQSSTPSPYTPGGRSRLLFSIGVPPHLHDPARTKILIVSFGGQVFRAPSRPQSRSATPTPPSPISGPGISSGLGNGSISRIPSPGPCSSSTNGVSTPPPPPHTLLPVKPQPNSSVVASTSHHPHHHHLHNTHVHFDIPSLSTTTTNSTPIIEGLTHAQDRRVPPPRLATPSHIWIPGAPPASKPAPNTNTTNTNTSTNMTSFTNGTFTQAGLVTPPPKKSVPELATIPPTPNVDGAFDLSAIPVSSSSSFSSPPSSAPTTTSSTANLSAHLNDCLTSYHISAPNGIHDIEQESRLLPDESWIAIVCGASKSAVGEEGGEGEGLPDGFYVAPKDVYMPDLTAVGDVLLGKLVSRFSLWPSLFLVDSLVAFVIGKSS